MCCTAQSRIRGGRALHRAVKPQGGHLADVRGAERVLLECGGGRPTLPEPADVLSTFEATPATVISTFRAGLARPLVQSCGKGGTVP